MNEIFKKIDGFENYSVSDHGNVRNDKTGRILKPGLNSSCYLSANLCKHKEQYSKNIHRLVAQAFLPNPENKPQVDHIDNNKSNNNINNLRWATNSQNRQNTTIGKNNRSGTKGVRWIEKTQKWRARIMVNGKETHLGYFVNKDDAINIRAQKAQNEFGEYINKCELVNY